MSGDGFVPAEPERFRWGHRAPRTRCNRLRCARRGSDIKLHRGIRLRYQAAFDAEYVKHPTLQGLEVLGVLEPDASSNLFRCSCVAGSVLAESPLSAAGDSSHRAEAPAWRGLRPSGNGGFATPSSSALRRLDAGWLAANIERIAAGQT